MSLRKKWFHFYSYFLKVAPSSGMGLRFVFSGIRFSGVLRMGMAFIFSMSSMAQATPKQREAVVKVVMAEIPWNQRPMKLTELMDYGKNFLPPILLQQLQANYMLYGDIEIPKMEVSRVKVGSQEHVRLTMTEKGMTNTITLIDDGKVFARLNDKVDILKEDMRSLTTVVAKVYQAIPVQAPKGPFLDDWDYGRLTPKGRLEYIKKLREIMVLMEKIQNNSGQGSTPDISWNLPIDDSISKAEVNFEQNPMTTTAGFFPHSGLSFSTATAVFKSWWRYMLSGAQAAAGGKYPLILAGEIISDSGEMKEYKDHQNKCDKGKIYCDGDLFPVEGENNCIARPRGSQWTNACLKASESKITFRAKEPKNSFNQGDLKGKLDGLSAEIFNACHNTKGKAVKDGAACSDLEKRIGELKTIYSHQTAANQPIVANPPASPAQDLEKKKHDRINQQCGAISEGGYSTQLLSGSNATSGPLKGQAQALLASGGSEERITKPDSFTAICSCAEPAVSVYALPQKTIVDTSKATELTLDSCKPPTPEKPAGGGGGGGSSRRSQWWNPNSWCESSTCRMGLAIGAIAIPIGLGIMGYRQSMKMQDKQQKAQQEWYASMLGGGAATMPPTMSLYTPSALRPTDMFNFNSNTSTQDTLR